MSGTIIYGAVGSRKTRHCKKITLSIIAITQQVVRVPFIWNSRNPYVCFVLTVSLHSLSTVIVEVEDPGRVYTDEVSEVTLSCELYGYPRDSFPPVWTSTSNELQSGRFTTTVTNAGLLNVSSVSTTEKVVSQLTISNVTERDSGEYTCSVQGNSTTVKLDIITGKST